jgi:tripartite-type tricarboxylate transporter receptor subunit TctC
MHLDVPALAEFGMKDMDAGSGSGLAVPKGTPAQVSPRLNAAVRKAAASPDVGKLFDEQSFVSTPGTPKEMRQFIEAETRRYTPVIRKLNLAE